MRPSEVIADLRARLADAEALIDLQRGQLAAEGVEGFLDPTPLLRDLKTQERALVGILLRAFPTTLCDFAILERLPGRDHAEDRDVTIVRVLACRARKVLGHDAIETVRGCGYRLGSDFRKALKST